MAYHIIAYHSVPHPIVSYRIVPYPYPIKPDELRSDQLRWLHDTSSLHQIRSDQIMPLSAVPYRIVSDGCDEANSLHHSSHSIVAHASHTIVTGWHLP